MLFGTQHMALTKQTLNMRRFFICQKYKLEMVA